MKKLLTIGLLLSLSIGSAQALRLATKGTWQTPGYVPTHAQKADAVTKLKNTVAVDQAKVAGLKTQVKKLKKPAQTSPVVEKVLESKEEKLIKMQDAIKAATQKLRASKDAVGKSIKNLF